MKLLVTGGAGFIGSNFIQYILDKYKKYRVCNLDKLTYAGDLDKLKCLEKNSRYSFIRGDINDENLLNDIFKLGIDAVVHFAAETHVARSFVSPRVFLETNVLGTQRILAQARSHRVSKIIHISTDEVYGSREKGFFKENDVLMATNPYAASKVGAEIIARSYFHTYKLPVIVMRPSNNYGHHQYIEKLVPGFIYRAIKNKPLPLHGDGMSQRDWVHVLDTARAVDLALHKGRAGEIYNIGAKNQHTNKQIAEMILKSLGKKKELISYTDDRICQDRRYAIDNSKIRQEIGWKPEIPFDKGFEEVVEWYRKKWEK